MNGETILVVDDNKEIVYSISELLKYEGYQIVKAYDGMEALNALETNQIDLILLDVMMPKLNGLSALMKLRENYRIPVIILSAKTEESDKVSGLVLGADDYVEKPYNPAELIARVKAHLRRYHAWGGAAPKTDSDTLVNGGLVLDKKQRLILVEGEEVRLTATEYKILELLMGHLGQVFSAEQIYENVWKESANYTVENTVMVHIRHIREKIEIDTKKPRYVKVVWGIGYKMEKYHRDRKTFLKATVAGISKCHVGRMWNFYLLYPDRLSNLLSNRKNPVFWDTREYSVRKRDCISVRKGTEPKISELDPKRRCLLSGMESRNEKNGASSSSDRYSGICSSRYLLCAAE